jgi:uncharacterized membrane protein
LTETIYSKSPANSIAPADTSAKLFLLLVIVLFIGARLWHLTSSCLWFDEIFSVHAAGHSWRTILPFAAADLVHPPLFYILLKIWIGVGGESLLWLRLFPAIISIAAIVPVMLMSRELNLSAAQTALALLLLAVNGYLIKYAQEVRMYSLLFFFSSCSLWLFIASIRRPKFSNRMLVALTAVNLLMIYTHYYGWLLTVIELAVAVWMNRVIAKRLIVSLLILLASYVPWVLLIVRAFQVQRLDQNVGWIPRPGLRTLIEFAMSLAQPFVSSESNVDRLNLFGAGLALLIFIAPVGILVRQSLRRPRNDREGSIPLLAVLTFAPILLMLLASWALPRSIWGARHLIIVFVPFAMIAAIAIVRLRPHWARVTIIVIAGCWFSATAVYVLIRPKPHFIWCAWGSLAEPAARQDQSSSRPTSLYAFEDLVAYHLWFALKDTNAGTQKVSVIKNLPGTVEDTAYFLPRDFKDIEVRGPEIPNETEIWIAFRGFRVDEQQPPLKQFVSAGYQIRQVLNERAQGQNAFMIRLARVSRP